MLSMFSNEYTQISFKLENERLFIQDISFFGKKLAGGACGTPHSFVFLVGGAYGGRQFNRHAVEGEILSYVSHSVKEFDGGKQLIIEEKNERISVKTTYVLYNGIAVLSCKSFETPRSCIVTP